MDNSQTTKNNDDIIIPSDQKIHGKKKTIIGLCIVAVALLAVVLFLSKYYLNNADKKSEDSNENSVSYPISYPISYPQDDSELEGEVEKLTEEVCGLSKYKNNNFPDFSFQFDSCMWNISFSSELNSLRSNSPIIDLKLIDTDTELRFLLKPLYDCGGPVSCYEDTFTIVVPNASTEPHLYEIARVPYNSDTNIKYNYEYMQVIMPANIKDENIYGDVTVDEASYCKSGCNALTTLSTKTASELELMGYADPQKPLPFEFSVYLKDLSLSSSFADEIIRSLTY